VAPGALFVGYLHKQSQTEGYYYCVWTGLFHTTTMSILAISFLSLSLAASALATPLSTSHQYDVRQGSSFVLAPILTAEHEAPHGLINNSYIVMLKKDLPLAAIDNHYNFLQVAHAEDPLLEDESGIRHVFDSHIKGYAGKFSDSVLQRIREMPEVDYVERDQIVKTQDTQKAAPWVRWRRANSPFMTHLE
jgi:cerevisin